MEIPSSSASHANTPVSHRNDLLFLGFIMVTGALAFLWAGYRGNPTDPNRIIREPWTLFGYFCLAMIAMELLILLTSVPRPSRPAIIVTLGVTGGWIIVVGVLYLTGPGHIFTWIQQHAPEVAVWLGANKQITFNTMNLVCIVILWLGIRLGSYDAQAVVEGERKPYMGERLVGDLLIGTLFSIILAWVFFWPLWQLNTALAAPDNHVQLLTASPGITVCDLTYLPFATPCRLAPFDLSTIFMLDTVLLPLVYLGIALSMLLYAAYGEALEAMRRQLAEGARPAFPAFPAAFWRVVRDVVNRRLRQLPIVLFSLRYFWPLLLLAAVVLAGVASKAIAQYLYSVALASKGRVLWLSVPDLLHGNLALEFGAAAAVLIALAATVIAATVRVIAQARGTRQRQWSDIEGEISVSWPRVQFIAVTLASSYWALSLVFSIINGLALIGVREYGIVTHTPDARLQAFYWAPFVQPDPLILVSFAVFLFYSIRLLVMWRANKRAAHGDSANSQAS